MKSTESFKQVFLDASKALERSAGLIESDKIDQLISIFSFLKQSGGSLFFTGVGKSGLVGEKLSSTFASLGLPSFVLHPVEALHGDLGRLTDKDCLVLLSKSGTTAEIVKLFPYLTLPKEHIIGLLGEVNSPIAEKCGLVFDCSVEKEACIHNKAPTTSTTVAQVCGDAMAVLYEQFSGLSEEQFASNHPGGRLGKSLRLKVKELMVPVEDCAVVTTDSNLKDALLAMTKNPVGLCCILSGAEFRGIIGEADVRRFFSENDSKIEINVSDVMNTSPKTISSADLALDAFNLMENPSRPFYQLPVVDGGKLVGVLRMHDLLKEGF